MEAGASGAGGREEPVPLPSSSSDLENTDACTHYCLQDIYVDSIDEAVGEIVQRLVADNYGGRRHNVIYFDGWDGLGASAVLRAVGERLSAGPEFSQVIHIDCSKWESRRAMQRALAEKLQLPAPVMEMFDVQDEEDDYKGVGKGSRLEIPEVAKEIIQHILKQPSLRFLVIFNNGSCEEIDLERLGFPVSGYLIRNKVLWSFQGGFRLYPRTKVDRALESTRTSTDVVLSATLDDLNEEFEDQRSKILRHEAEEAAHGLINIGGIDWPATTSECFLYMMRLCGMGSHLVDYDLATHGCNYWICDGIIQLKQQGDDGADTLWLCSDALKREMQLDTDYRQTTHSPSPLARHLHKRTPYWASPRYVSTLIPMTGQYGRVPQGMFQQYDKLCVLKLSACMFSFRSPPFLCCHNLRFLWLDHCQDGDESSSTDDGVGNEEDIRRCFQRLWVLDVRYSSSEILSEKMMDLMTQLRELHVMGQVFDMGALQGRLHNIRKLRLRETEYHHDGGSQMIVLSGKEKMELLDLTGICDERGMVLSLLSVEISCSSLETVIIDGWNCFDKISLEGCARLKNLLLSGSSRYLYSLDLTGTAVETLDLSAVTAPALDELFLLGCEKLCAILWPPPGEGRRKAYLGKLRIDTAAGTTQKEATDAAAGSSRGSSSHAGFDWYICVRDARLLGSLEPVRDYFGAHDVHVEISTTAAAMAPPLANADAAGAGSKKDVVDKSGSGQQQVKYHATYHAIGMPQQEQITDGPPPAPPVSPQGCYMHIQDNQQKPHAAADASRIMTAVPGFICDGARTLHVHNSLFATSAPFHSAWNQLEWCRVERCPGLERVFLTGANDAAFSKLRTMCASHLLNARKIFLNGGALGLSAFKDLTLLQLYGCPRLMSVFYTRGTVRLQSLDTLEIMWCGDLRDIIFLQWPYIEFPNLKRIHLHELPKLQAIFNVRRGPNWSLPALAPMLKIVKIRGCWSLRELPLVGTNYKVECDCEKEWWDGLRRYSTSHLDNYKPKHPRYYKKTMLRASVLR
ncbi:hypothetical protein U9M48_004849 [Paspalum notatum var. saurae]|uniref:Uncharacterized protein n=1 Tax=Paspalum notatum var. saurae TaxID=547442 RepID=A0AAQ3PU40_PASNO